VDGAFSANNEDAGIVVRQPRSLGERAEVAHACSAKLRITVPLVVDTIDDRVGHAYSGMPDRLYVMTATAGSPTRAAAGRSASSRRRWSSR
jgi:hypothetical protein